MSNDNTQPSTVEQTFPVDALGPPGTKGQLVVVALMENEQRTDLERVTDKNRRHFKITARLSKNPLPTGDIKGNFDANDGGSYLHMPEDQVLIRVESPDGNFEINKNNLGEQSIVEFECESTSANDAKTTFLRAALQFLDYQAYLANCPLFITCIRIEDTQNICTVIDYISPYRKVIINSHIKSVEQDLIPIYALYRDAKHSHSDFYSFLCYHKILDGLLGTVRAKLRQRAAKKGVQLTQRHDQVPSDPNIDAAFRSYIGKPIRSFFDDVMTPQFRTAVAHFTQKDGSILNLSSPIEIDRYASILYISELCVREVIERHEAHLMEIASAT
jgi:hypothetical protein